MIYLLSLVVMAVLFASAYLHINTGSGGWVFSGLCPLLISLGLSVVTLVLGLLSVWSSLGPQAGLSFTAASFGLVSSVCLSVLLLMLWGPFLFFASGTIFYHLRAEWKWGQPSRMTFPELDAMMADGYYGMAGKRVTELMKVYTAHPHLHWSNLKIGEEIKDSDRVMESMRFLLNQEKMSFEERMELLDRCEHHDPHEVSRIRRIWQLKGEKNS